VHVGDVIVDSENENNAMNDAIYLIDRALGRICFAYNIGALNDRKSILCDRYVKDTGTEKLRKGLRVRRNYVKENPQMTLSNITSLDSDRLEVMDLAFAYYKLSEYDNPL
jgi:hypothetical protein